MGTKKLSSFSVSVLTTIIIVMVVAGFGVVYLFTLDSAFHGQSKERFSEETGIAACYVENGLSTTLGIAETYAMAFTDYASMDEETLENRIKVVLANGCFDDLCIIDENGNAYTYNTDWVDLGKRDYYKTAMSGIANVSKTLVSDYYSEDVNVFAVPIRDKNSVLGVLACVMSEEKFKETITISMYGRRDACYIVSSSGEIVVTPNSGDLPLLQGDNFFNTVHTDEVSKMNALNAFAAKDGAGSFNATIKGIDYYVGYDTLGVGDWVLLTTVPVSEIQKNATVASIASVVFFAVVMLVIMLMSLFIMLAMRKFEREIRARDDEFTQLAFVDSVTGFSTWNKFRKTVPDLLKDYSTNYAVLSFDINKFRAVNDFLGHEEGNLILKKLAGIINRNCGNDETFARSSADVFYALASYKGDDELLEKIENIISDTDYQITEFKILLSFGIYRITERNMPIRSMADRADLARRTIKGRNESSYAFFDASMLSKIREEKAIENIMESALESNEFKVYLQPKYDMNDEKVITGAEALVRWKRGDEIIPPGRFIPLFEKNRFVLRLDMYIFEEVVKQQKIWLNRGLEPIVISVNMSRVHLQDQLFVSRLAEICRRYNVSTKYFEIEITESAAFENLEVLSRVFRELKSHNFHISIDDFGTGYSSLNMLKDLPVDVLKIDREFLTGSSENDRASEIIAHVISLAVALKMRTICEGIETLEQVHLLRKLGCDMAQGFYFARPMPVPDFESLAYGNQ